MFNFEVCAYLVKIKPPAQRSLRPGGEGENLNHRNPAIAGLNISRIDPAIGGIEPVDKSRSSGTPTCPVTSGGLAR